MMNGQPRPSEGTCRADEADGVLALGTVTSCSPAARELFHLGDTADSIYLMARGHMRLTLPMQVRSREEDVLVEERSAPARRWAGRP